MRLVIDTLIAVMVIALGWIVLQHRQHIVGYTDSDLAPTHDALAHLHDKLFYEKSMGRLELNSNGFPDTIDKAWFGEKVPINTLLGDEHVWIDIAPEGDYAMHPPDPVAERTEQGGFWYNPNRGIFRARVPRSFLERDTLKLYNRVNHTSLTELPEDPSKQREPIDLDGTPRGTQNDPVEVDDSQPRTLKNTPLLKHREKPRDAASGDALSGDTISGDASTTDAAAARPGDATSGDAGSQNVISPSQRPGRRIEAIAPNGRRVITRDTLRDRPRRTLKSE